MWGPICYNGRANGAVRRNCARMTGRSESGGTQSMHKKLNYMEIVKETGILTAAVAIIAAAVYFFLAPSHTSVSIIS